MAKEKASEKLIEKIYRRKYEDIAMVFFVDGQRSIVPAISVEKALYNFFKHIGEEDYNMESALTIYGRLKKEYYESTKTNI
ncbi:MAG TPA: hypothetical protein VFC41_01465 [Anaerovoracaceae bacterium]|nr:hypothetical protein [Anaerovoracaceae bacterium]